MKSSKYSRHVHPCLPLWSWRGQYWRTVGHKERMSQDREGSFLGAESTREPDEDTTYQVMASSPKYVLSSGFSVLPPNLMDFLVILTPHSFPPGLLITPISVVHSSSEEWRHPRGASRPVKTTADIQEQQQNSEAEMAVRTHGTPSLSSSSPPSSRHPWHQCERQSKAPMLPCWKHSTRESRRQSTTVPSYGSQIRSTLCYHCPTSCWILSTTVMALRGQATAQRLRS